MVEVIEIADGYGVVFACTGRVDMQQLVDSKTDFQARFPRAASWFFAIVDFRGTAQFDVAPEEIPQLVARDNELAHMTRPALPVAIIAPEALMFDTSRVWQAVGYSTGWESKIFREREAAETWLRHRVSAAYRVELPADLAA
jgi:hypothetical protein